MVVCGRRVVLSIICLHILSNLLGNFPHQQASREQEGVADTIGLEAYGKMDHSHKRLILCNRVDILDSTSTHSIGLTLATYTA